jgi:hypothetical protein
MPRWPSIMTCTLALALFCLSVPAIAAPFSDGLQAFAQAEQETVTKKVSRWTKARLEAAKKRWAQNREKFSACNAKLAEAQKTKRMTVHNQGHFLEACMRAKP